MEKSQSKMIYVVVEVMAGIPVSVEGYRDYAKAKNREAQLRKNINPEKDEIGLFGLKI